MKKGMIAAALAACLVLLATTAAVASTVLIEPSGETTETTTAMRFKVGANTITCPMTLAGTLASMATGTLTETARAEVNPTIGRMATARIGLCSGGSVIALLTGSNYIKHVMGTVPGHSEQVVLYFLDYEILVNDGSTVRCLLRLEVVFIYEIPTGKLTVRETFVLSSIRLEEFRCPENREVVMSGIYSVAPINRITII